MAHTVRKIDVLVIGAGPFGLAVAAEAMRRGLDVMASGESMAFWKHNMPSGMLLRSEREWHLDAAEIHTLEAFLEEKRIPPKSVEPLPVETLREYAEWFRKSKGIDVQPLRVTRLRRSDGTFQADCEKGETIYAKRVLATPGLAPFANMPDDLTASLPSD